MKWDLIYFRGWGFNPPINPIFGIGSVYYYLPPPIVSIINLIKFKGEYATGFT